MTVKLPPSLNEVAAAWRHFFEEIPFTLTKNFDAHVKGSHSVYVLEITLQRTCGDNVVYYVGQTANPSLRANAHKHELQRCRTTTFVGKSVLYTAELIAGLQAVQMYMYVQQGGLSEVDAKLLEKTVAAALTEEYGAAVLTRPNGAKLPVNRQV